MNSIIKTPYRSRLALATAMLLTCVCGAPSAFAGEEVRSEKVKFQDLNVDSPEGVQALYGRIHAAAKRVCVENDLARLGAQKACTKKAELNAIDKLNLPQLTMYYKIKTGDSTQPLVAAR
jgi:UrcA family protein